MIQQVEYLIDILFTDVNWSFVSPSVSKSQVYDILHRKGAPITTETESYHVHLLAETDKGNINT